MAELGKRFTEISRGYEVVSNAYNRPYIIGVDINDISKPFVLASGDAHCDTVAITVSTEELLSGQWDKHIDLSNGSDFIELLKREINKGETFPTSSILKIVS